MIHVIVLHFGVGDLAQDFFDGTFLSWSGVDESKAKCGVRPPDDRGPVNRDGLGVDATL